MSNLVLPESNTSKLREVLSDVDFSNENPGYLESLEEYYNSVLFLSKNNLSLEFNNKDQNHGVLVMSLLFKEATSKIRIFAGDFVGKLSDKELYVNELINAVKNRKVQLEVVFENQPNEKSKCLSSLKELFSSNKDEDKLIRIYQLNDNYKKILKEKFKNILHFTVVDDNKFRFETDPDSYKAICNFDDKELSEILISNFDKLRLNSNPYNF